MKIVSLIPARLGSKGIKQKNIVKLNNYPLIYYSIKASLLSNVNETWISSESKEILDVAKCFGSKTIKRPAHFATDYSSTEDVIKHFISQIECDIIVLVQATSPLLKSSDINKGISMYMNDKYDSVFSVCKFNAFLWNSKKESINYDYNNRVRRQEKEDDNYIENGAFWIFSKKGFQRFNNRIFGKIGYCEMPFWRSFEVDDIEDIINIQKLMS